MATLTNNLKSGVDLPVWEWCRFAPVATAATSATAADGERYIYYLSSTFYKYDTWTDGWIQLATPNTAAVTSVSLKYSPYQGFRGNVLNATANTITIAGFKIALITGKTIRIVSGTGTGQERTILGNLDATIYDHGMVTAASASSLTDGTKRWMVNQWRGMQVRTIYGTGYSQMKVVLYNSETTLYFSDTNWQGYDSWNNTGFSSVSPNAIPVATAGSQTHYVIEATTALVAPWDITPDTTSIFMLVTGGIWMLSSVASAPWSSLQYYDVIRDNWYTKTAIGGHLLAALGTDWSIEQTGEVTGEYTSGITASSTLNSLTSTTTTMTADQYSNFQIRITSGSGKGQQRRISGNTNSTFFINKAWDVNPSGTDTYEIYGDTEAIHVIGNNASAMYQYRIEDDMWSSGSVGDTGIIRNASIQRGKYAFGITSITLGSACVVAVAAAPTAGGNGYIVGDILSIDAAGGTAAKVIVAATSLGVVTAVALYGAGSGLTGYTTGSGKATTAISPATGTGCTVDITVSTAGRIVTDVAHNIKMGDTVVITGAGGATTGWNGSWTALCADTTTTIDIYNNTATMTLANTTTTTMIVDSTKNWVTDEHKGKIIHIYTVGASPTLQSRKITGNTATTISWTLAATLPVSGTSRYLVQEPYAYGRDQQYRKTTLSGVGWATSGTSGSLTDSTKAWVDSMWAGYKLKVICGTGYDKGEVTILTNDATTLTLSSPGFTPDSSTKYVIEDSFGLCSGTGSTTTIPDTSKNWSVNQWAGKRVKLLSGTGQSVEATILSNTATVLTTTATMGATPNVSTSYTILSTPQKGTGNGITWIYGGTGAAVALAGQYLVTPRGNNTVSMDIYHIPSELWDYALFLTPNSELVTTGSMYAYDGGDYIYATVNATGRVIQIHAVTTEMTPYSLTPYAHGTAVLGQRMEIVTMPDGLQYLYIMRHSGQEMWRTLLF